MLPSLRRAREESEAVTDNVPAPSQKGMGKLWNHLQNSASRTQYLEASNTEPAGTCSSMNTVTSFLIAIKRHLMTCYCCCTCSTHHGTLFPFSLFTSFFCLHPNRVCHTVQARLCCKCCRHVISLGPYHLSMMSPPSALAAVQGCSYLLVLLYTLIGSLCTIHRCFPLTQLLFGHWSPLVA